MQFKELNHFLENITTTDLAPHFISYLKDHRYIKTKNIVFEFLKTIDGSITPRSEIYKKLRIKLTTRLKCLTKKALDLGYLEKYSPSVYETTNKIKKIKTPSEIMPLLLDSLNHRVIRFLDINPNASLQELCRSFPDQNKTTLSNYRSCYFFKKNNKIYSLQKNIMQFKELNHFLENITTTDLAPHFISYLKDHRYIKTKNIVFEFLKTIDGSITPRSEIYKKLRIKLTTRLKCLTKKALDLGYLEKYSPSVYETTNKIKKIKTPSEIMPLLLDSLNHRVIRFLDINPNASLQELCRSFPDQNKGTLSYYRSCYFKHVTIKTALLELIQE